MIPAKHFECTDTTPQSAALFEWMKEDVSASNRFASKLPSPSWDAWEEFSVEYFVCQNIDNADIRQLPDGSLFDTDSGHHWANLHALYEAVDADSGCHRPFYTPTSWWEEDDDCDFRRENQEEMREE